MTLLYNMEKEIFIFFGVLIIVGLLVIWYSNYRFLKNEKKEKAEEERINQCKHENGFTILKVFGYPDIRECNDCGRLFEQDGEEISRRYLNRLLDNTEEWIDNADGWRKLRIYLTHDSFRKLYALSVGKKKTMDDMIAEMIENYDNDKTE